MLLKNENQKEIISKITSWLLVVLSLAHAFWLLIIPGESFLSLKRLLILMFILLPLMGFVFLQTKTGKIFVVTNNNYIYRCLNLLTGLIFTGGFFFLLMPTARFRFQLPPSTWDRLLPLVSLYLMLACLRIIHIKIGQKTNIEKINPGKREVFIDFARGFAIVLALTSHAFYAFGYSDLFDDHENTVKSITRFATPGFILITGMMFELVHFRKAEKHGFAKMAKSLLLRAGQCYFAYLITVFIEWFNQHLTNQEALQACLFIGKSLFSGVLKFYTIFLILAILIIWLRKRIGIWFIVSLPIIVWLVDLVLNRITWPEAGTPFSYLTGLLTGHPSVSNFSIWHALTFMSVGILVGFAFKQSRQTGTWTEFNRMMGILVLIGTLTSLIAVLPTSFVDLQDHFANSFRSDHHIAYYSIGSTGALLLLWLFWLIRDHLNGFLLRNTITTLGMDSLWAFAVGNSLSALLPAANTRPLTVTTFVLAVSIGSVLIIHLKNLINKPPVSTVVRQSVFGQ